MNPNPLSPWSGSGNIAKVGINGESSWALLDSGLTINLVTPEFTEAHSLHVGALTNLANGTLGINGFGGVFSLPLEYIIIRAQVEGVWGYNKDQVALVIPDSTIFGSQVLVTLGTPTISHIINMIKESKIKENASKLGLGAVPSQKLTNGQYHLVVYRSQSVTIHEHNYHSMKQEFLAVKWPIAEQFQEYLL